MERYEIRCTKEQTIKALELGAPIYNMPSNISVNGCGWFDYMGKSYLCPTAEQMIGWLEEDGKCLINVAFGDGIFTRKELTLSAINSALEYLKSTKQE